MPTGTLNEILPLLRRRDAPEVLRYKRDGAWRSMSAREVYRQAAQVALSLARMGIERGDRVALLSENRPEWALADFAILACGAADVPLYPTLTAASCEYILRDSGARAAFVSNAAHLEKICSVWARLPDLKFAVVMNPDVETGSDRVRSWRDLCPDGELNAEEQLRFEQMLSAAQPGDLASLIYTSGTTGEPKGVMLTHSNLVSNALATDPDVVGEGDLALSFLPLSHVYERIADYVYFYRGVTIAYAESIEAVPQNLLELRPTVAAAVPRFFEKLYARVLDSLRQATPARRKIFWWAVDVGRQVLRRRIAGKKLSSALRLRHALAERLVFSKLRERLGGRIRCFISGGAPLSPELAEFFNAASVTICEGYGLTETSPIVAANVPSRIRPGTVGRPLAGVEVKIADDGEVLVRGPNVMKGYWNQPEETVRVLRDGWLHTGDIGEFTAEGDLRITDRKKDLLKTAGGKFVAPQPIENLLRACPYFLNAVVIGDKRPYVTALLVPNPEKLKEAGAPADEIARREIDAINARLAPFEQIKRFALLERDFSVESGELTPTLKVKRRIVEAQYRDIVESLYK